MRGYRYRLSPTPAQAEVMEQYAGVCRLVYNLALEQRRDFWRQYRSVEGRHISFASQCREVTELRRDFDWVRSVPTDATTYALRDLDRAYRDFFTGRTGYPAFRRKGRDNGFRMKGSRAVVEPINRKWARVRLANLGWVKFRLTRPIVGEVKNVAFSFVDGHWYASFAALGPEVSDARCMEAVGIDRGVAQTLTLSNGEHVQAPAMPALLGARRRAQKALARCRKGSERRRVRKAEVARLSARMARIRQDWAHRTSTDIARRFGLVAIEALNIKNMTASAAGTAEAPGLNVRQKAGLNRSILEQAWGSFATMLDYKLTERGGVLISVPAAYTSQTCAGCGVVDARSRKSQAVFACVHCGHEDNADVNAAKEILRRSTSGLGVEARVAGPANRQPQGAQHV